MNIASKNRFGLIIFDIDGTITTHISSWRYIHERLGIWDTIAQKHQKSFLKGSISYKKFCKLDAAHWKGLKVTEVRRLFKDVHYSTNVRWAIKKFKHMGFKLAAVSTGLQFLAERVKNELGFDYVVSNVLTEESGKFNGRVVINLSHGDKGKAVRKILTYFGINKDASIGVGDTDGDIPLVKACGYSIAFNSTSEELSSISDYNCTTRDFKEIYNKVSSLMKQNICS